MSIIVEVQSTASESVQPRCGMKIQGGKLSEPGHNRHASRSSSFRDGARGFNHHLSESWPVIWCTKAQVPRSKSSEQISVDQALIRSGGLSSRPVSFCRLRGSVGLNRCIMGPLRLCVQGRQFCSAFGNETFHALLSQIYQTSSVECDNGNGLSRPNTWRVQPLPRSEAPSLCGAVIFR